ncbi:MAG: GGDEF domain-containing protein [Desulfobacterales bacterium]|nr:GGDEF domain-containing protein [Desulfobacterales bacterium]
MRISFMNKPAVQLVGRDITQQKKYQQMLEELSMSDALTGLPNRRKLFEHLKLHWNMAKRNKFPISIIMIDIDFFKKYNDTYGHQKGDECLKAIALILEKNIRRPGDIVARYGGEEFTVVLPATNEEGALSIAESMRESVLASKIESKDSPNKHVTISVGIATEIPEAASMFEDLIGKADKALYQAKNTGRNKCIQA